MDTGTSTQNMKNMMINDKDTSERKDKIGVYEIPIENEEGKNRVHIGGMVRSYKGLKSIIKIYKKDHKQQH